MKRSCVLLLIVLSMISCRDTITQVENDWDKHGLQGVVKEVHSSLYKNDSLFVCEENHYNKQGFVTHNKMFKSDSLVSTQFISRNEDQRILTIRNTQNNGELEELIYDYDKSGLRLITQKVNGVKQLDKKYSNDKKGRIVNELVYNDGAFYMGCKIVYQGDSITRSTFYKEDNSVVSIIEIRQSEKTNLIDTKFEQHIGKGIIVRSRVVIQLDSLGNHLTETSYTNGKQNQDIRYEYDFDSNSNWITQYKFNDGEMIERTNRIIKYY